MKIGQLTYDEKQLMIDYLVNRAGEPGKDPLVIAICDGAKELVSLKMMDGTYKMNEHLASNKAYTAALIHQTTKSWKEFMEKKGTNLAVYGDPRMTSLPGGTPVITEDGVLLGAVGVSGWSMEEDQMLASEAVEALKSAWREGERR